MRLLFCGDSAGTGFGNVTRDLGAALIAEGVDVRFMSINEQPGTDLGYPFEGRTADLGIPSGWLVSGPENHREALAAAYEKITGMFTGGLFEDGWQPTAAIILGDMGSLDISPVVDLIPDGFPAVHYVPIEGVGLPPSWGRTWAKLPPVAISEAGATEIERVTGKRPPVIYHGVDTSIFHPVYPWSPIVIDTGTKKIKLRSKADCKQFVHAMIDPGPDPSHVWLYRADRLMPRKGYPSLLRSLAPVLRSHPNVSALFHCRDHDEGMPAGIGHEFSKYPDLRGRIGLTMQGGKVSRDVLAILYNAADIYVSNSAEGFGLTLAESIACGTPAVGLDFSAVPEVIGPAGVTVSGGLIDNPYSYFWALANEREFGAAVTALVEDVAGRQVMGGKGPLHVKTNFAWADKARQFIELLSPARIEVAA